MQQWWCVGFNMAALTGPERRTWIWILTEPRMTVWLGNVLVRGEEP